jgi:hypothetical protein
MALGRDYHNVTTTSYGVISISMVGRVLGAHLRWHICGAYLRCTSCGTYLAVHILRCTSCGKYHAVHFIRCTMALGRDYHNVTRRDLLISTVGVCAWCAVAVPIFAVHIMRYISCGPHHAIHAVRIMRCTFAVLTRCMALGRDYQNVTRRDLLISTVPQLRCLFAVHIMQYISCGPHHAVLARCMALGRDYQKVTSIQNRRDLHLISTVRGVCVGCAFAVFLNTWAVVADNPVPTCVQVDSAVVDDAVRVRSEF